MPDDLGPPPPDSELEEAEAIISALGAGTKVSPNLPDEGPGLLIKGLAAHRDDINREPLRDFGLQQHIEQGGGGSVSGFEELAQQFEGLDQQVPLIAGPGNDLAAAEQALNTLKTAATGITGEAAGANFVAEVERVNAQVRSAIAECDKTVAAMNELRQAIRSTANEIRTRTLGG